MKKKKLKIPVDFELKDKFNHYKNIEVLEYIKLKSKFLKKFNKNNTLILVKNNCGIFFWLNILTCIKNGFTVFPINSSYKINELKNYYKTIITLNKNKIFTKVNKKYIVNKNIKNFNFISATSGSTGKPKLILLDFNKILSNVKKVKSFCKLKKNKNYFVAIPGYFYSAILHFFTALINGSKFIHVEEKMFPLDLINNLNKYDANYFGGPPLHNKWVIESCNQLTKIEKTFSSGDFLDENTLKKYKSIKNKFEFFYMYGITEASGRVCINNLNQTKNFNSVGKPLSLYKFIFKNNEIYIKSNYLFFGYFFENKFELLKKNIYETGDQGLMLRNGSVILQGRKDDIFKSSGIKIFTQKIRNFLIQSKLFSDVFIFKGKLENYGYVPFCAYESQKQIKYDKIKSITSNQNQLDSFHIPKKFIWYKKLPRLANNKIDRLKIIKNEK